jgi:hypothetical protein
VDNRYIGHARERFANHFKSDIVPPTLVRKHAQKMQCVAILRVGPQDLPIEQFRICQLSGTMLMDCIRQELMNGWRWLYGHDLISSLVRPSMFSIQVILFRDGQLHFTRLKMAGQSSLINMTCVKGFIPNKNR